MNLGVQFGCPWGDQNLAWLLRLLVIWEGGPPWPQPSYTPQTGLLQSDLGRVFQVCQSFRHSVLLSSDGDHGSSAELEGLPLRL